MIKTLRITSIISALLAAVFVVFPGVLGAHSDEQIEEFLRSPGVVEEFRKDRGGKADVGKSQISPLVKQAEAFALYLNPPKKPKPTKRQTTKTRKKDLISARPKPKEVSAKFTLIGTSLYASHPELSLALIDEPGKGLSWVRQSSKVGHLTIEQVKDGVVVVRDAQRTFELTVAERPEKINLLKGEGGSKPASPPLSKAEAGVTAAKPAPPGRITRREPRRSSKDDDAILEEMLNEIRSKRGSVEGEETDMTDADIEAERALEDFISKVRAERISTREATKLGKLGKKLKGVRAEPNQAKNQKVKNSKISSKK